MNNLNIENYRLEKSHNILKILSSIENDKINIWCTFQGLQLFFWNYNQIRKSPHRDEIE